MTSRRSTLIEEGARELLQLHGYTVRTIPPEFNKRYPPAHLVASRGTGETRFSRIRKISRRPTTVKTVESHCTKDLVQYRKHLFRHPEETGLHCEIWLYFLSYGFCCFEVLIDRVQEIPQFLLTLAAAPWNVTTTDTIAMQKFPNFHFLYLHYPGRRSRMIATSRFRQIRYRITNVLSKHGSEHVHSSDNFLSRYALLNFIKTREEDETRCFRFRILVLTTSVILPPEWMCAHAINQLHQLLTPGLKEQYLRCGVCLFSRTGQPHCFGVVKNGIREIACA
ncbi:MAG: hypothetical protein NTV84_09090 [Methanoregula sp.]|nr:hypothetical protein [Methanoregula sp.]